MKRFEKFEDRPDVSLLSNEFWKMTEIADWKSVIEGYNDNPSIDQTHKDFYVQAQSRIYSTYDYSQIKGFFEEWNSFYLKLYDKNQISYSILLN